MDINVITCIATVAIAISVWNVSSWLKNISKILDKIDTKLSKEYKTN